MAQAGQMVPAGKSKSKGMMSSNNMISIGLGAGIVLEGVALALLWKKVNEIALRNDPNNNDNKNIAQYIALKDTENVELIKALDTRIKAIEAEQKKPTQQQALDPAITKRINQLVTDNKAQLEHINELTTAFNNLEAIVSELVAKKEKIPAKYQEQQQRGRSNRKQFVEDESEITISELSPSPPPRRATNIAPSKKPPTQQSRTNNNNNTTKSTQKTANQTNNKKKQTAPAKSPISNKATDEMPSEYEDD